MQKTSFVVVSLILMVLLISLGQTFLSDWLDFTPFHSQLLKGFLLAILVGYLIIISRYDVRNKIQKNSIEEIVDKFEFCYHCGANLEENHDICPACGKILWLYDGEK